MDVRKIFAAVDKGDPKTVRACIDAGADMAARNKQGFTALQLAAIGTNTLPLDTSLAMLRMLIDAGSPLELPSADGRTALYLAAEFSEAVEPVQTAPRRRRQGRHSATAMATTSRRTRVMEEVVANCSRASPASAGPGTGAARARTREDGRPRNGAPPRRGSMRVFEALTKAGVVTLHDAGQTQSDGFSDCSEAFRERGGAGGRRSMASVSTRGRT
jgi:hypothetical protein